MNQYYWPSATPDWTGPRLTSGPPPRRRVACGDKPPGACLKAAGRKDPGAHKKGSLFSKHLGKVVYKNEPFEAMLFS